MMDRALDVVARRAKTLDRKHDIPYLAGYSKRISRCGDEMMRVMLYEAAQSAAVEETLDDAARQASRDEEGDRGAGASVGRDHAPRVG